MEVLWNSPTTCGWDLIFPRTAILYSTEMLNQDNITNKNNKEHNKNSHLFQIIRYRMLIIGGFGSGKTNPLLNLRWYWQDDIDKIYLHAKRT